MFKGPDNVFETDRCLRWRVVEIERVHCTWIKRMILMIVSVENSECSGIMRIIKKLFICKVICRWKSITFIEGRDNKLGRPRKGAM